MIQIGLLGAGTWGIALARHLAIKGEAVTVWSALQEEVDTLSRTRCHANLPGVDLPDSIRYTAEISEAILGKEFVIVAVPSVYVRSTVRRAAPFLKESKPVIISVAKGLESGTLKTVSQIIEDEVGDEAPIVALSGPTHAEEVSRNLLTMIVSSSKNTEAALRVQELLSTEMLRVYTNEDILGVELCGSLKNVIALAAGICDGLGYGDNAKAALLTRGAAELSRLGQSMGCDPRTFSGLTGIGDLIVTATSRHSRNSRAGHYIGEGYSAKEAAEKVGMVVEGLNTLEPAIALIHQTGVEMPIVEAVNEIVNEGANPADVVFRLMTREKKNELA